MRCSSRSYLPPFVYSFVPSHLTGAMVDRTAYADEAHTPKIALRQIFGRLGLRSELCRAAADGGLLSVEVFAMLGDTATAVKTSLQTLLPTATLGVDAASQELSLMQLAAVWHSCLLYRGSSPRTGLAWKKTRTRSQKWHRRITQRVPIALCHCAPGCDPLRCQRTSQEVRREAQQRFSSPWHGAVLHRGRDPHSC